MVKTDITIITEADLVLARQIAWRMASKLGRQSIYDELESLCCSSLPNIIAKIVDNNTRRAYIKRSLQGYCLNYARSLGSRQLQDIASAYRKLIKSRPKCADIKKAAKILACTESLLAEALQHINTKQINENSCNELADSYEQAQLSIISDMLGKESYIALLEAIENGENIDDKIEEIRGMLCYNS